MWPAFCYHRVAFSGILYKWSLSICALSCLAFNSLSIIFRVILIISSVYFYCWVILTLLSGYTTVCLLTHLLMKVWTVISWVECSVNVQPIWWWCVSLSFLIFYLFYQLRRRNSVEISNCRLVSPRLSVMSVCFMCFVHLFLDTHSWNSYILFWIGCFNIWTLIS